MMSCGKWAPLKLIAIVVIPHDAPLVMKGDHTANGLKCKFATKPLAQRHLKDVGIEAELKIQEFGAYIATTFMGNF